jgi:integrase
MECHRLRVKDVNFDRNEITVRQGKGNKDQRVQLPAILKSDLKVQLEFVSKLYLKDKHDDLPGIELPHALSRKYLNAAKNEVAMVISKSQNKYRPQNSYMQKASYLPRRPRQKFKKSSQ